MAHPSPNSAPNSLEVGSFRFQLTVTSHAKPSQDYTAHGAAHLEDPTGGIHSYCDVWDRWFHLIQVWCCSDWVSSRTLSICFRISLLIFDESFADRPSPSWWLPSTLNPEAQTIQCLTIYHCTFLPNYFKCEILLSQEFLYGCDKYFLVWYLTEPSLSRQSDAPSIGILTTCLGLDDY